MSNFFGPRRARDALHAREDGLVIAESERRRRARTRGWNLNRQLERHLRASAPTRGHRLDVVRQHRVSCIDVDPGSLHRRSTWASRSERLDPPGSLWPAHCRSEALAVSPASSTRSTTYNERHDNERYERVSECRRCLSMRTSKKLNGGESPRSRFCCMCRRFLVLDQANPTQSREPQETEAEQREGHRLRRLPGRLEAFVSICLEHRVRPGEAVHGSHT